MPRVRRNRTGRPSPRSRRSTTRRRSPACLRRARGLGRRAKPRVSARREEQTPGGTRPSSDIPSGERFSPMLATGSTPGSPPGRSGAGRHAPARTRGSRSSGTASARSASGTARRCACIARRGTDITARYPELTADGARPPRRPRGRSTARSSRSTRSGRPSFSLLQNRMHLTRAREIAARHDALPSCTTSSTCCRHDGAGCRGDPSARAPQAARATS